MKYHLNFTKHAVFCVLFLLPLFTQAQEKNDSIPNTLLWRIKGKGIKTSYLYGTMHVRDLRAFDFADSVLIAFGSCESYAMEIHPDSMNKMLFGNMENSMAHKYYGSDDEEFIQKLGQEKFNEIDNKLQKESGISFRQIKNKNPRLIRSLLSEAEVHLDDKPVFLDLFLYDMAGGEDKRIFGLESLQGTEKTVNALHDVKKDYEMQVDYVDKVRSFSNLIEYYQDNDLNAVYALYFDTLSFNVDYRKTLLDNRNAIMANSIDTILKKQSCFTAVGCAHLIGEQGLIALLRKMGYTVEPVYPSKTGVSGAYPMKFRPLKWQPFEDVAAGYSINFPGTPYPVKVPYTETDMILFNDMGKGSVFFSYGIFTSPEFTNMKSAKMYNKMLDNIDKQVGTKVFDRKKTMLGNLEAVEANLSRSDFKFKILLVRKDRMVYMLMAGDQNDAVSDQVFQEFISSFQTKAIPPKEWTLFESYEDGFKVSLPGKAITREMNIQQAGDEVPMRMHIANNPKSGVNYVIQCLDLPNGKYNNDDSSMVDIMSDAILENLGNPVVIRDKRGFLKENRYRDLIFSEKKVSYRLVTYSRVNRIFNLIATYREKDSVEVNAFVQSFDWLTFKEPDFTTYSPADSVFTVSMPKIFDEDSTEYLPKGMQSQVLVQSKDKYSSNLYLVQNSHYSSLYSTSDSLLIKKMKDILVNEEDTLISETQKDIKGGKQYDFIYDLPASHVEKRITHVLSGKNLYSFVAYYEPELKDSKAVKGFFESITVNEKKKEGDLFSDKKELLKKQLQHPTLPADEIKDAVDDVKWEAVDMDLLLRALQIKFKDDTLDYSTVNSYLFDALRTLEKVKVTEKLKKIYPELSKTDKRKALSYYAATRTLESVKLLKTTLLADPSVLEDHYNLSSITSDMSDSAALVKELYPALLPLLSDTMASRSLYQMLLSARDSNWVSKEEIEKYKDILLKRFKEDVEQTRKEFDEDSYFPYWLISGIHLVYSEKFYSDETDVLVMDAMEMYETENTDLAYAVVEEFLKADKNISEERKQAIFKNQLYQCDLYKALKKVGKEKKIPAAYRDSLTLAKSDLYTYVYYDEMTPDQMKFVEKITITYEGEQLEVYLIKLSTKFENEEYWYMGVSGAYAKNNFFAGKKKDLTTYSWDDIKDFKGKSNQQIVEEILDVENHKLAPTH